MRITRLATAGLLALVGTIGGCGESSTAELPDGDVDASSDAMPPELDGDTADGDTVDGDATDGDTVDGDVPERDGGPDASGTDAATDGEIAPDASGPDAAPDASGPDAAPDATADAAGDAGPDGGTVSCTGGSSYFYVMDVIEVGREDPAGVAPGFDLDGHVSSDTDPIGCFQPDFTAPDGTPGIDNQLATLVPTLESLVGIDLDIQLQNAIQSGELLLLVELEGVDDFTNDGCVVVNVMTGLLPPGVSTPMVDASGRFVPGQRFDVDASSLDMSGMARTRLGGQITAGVLTTGRGDFPFVLPLDPTTAVDITIQDGMLEAQPSASELQNGVLAGGLDIDDLVMALIAYDPSLPVNLVRNTLEGVADLDPVGGTGTCGSVSMTMLFDAMEAVRGATVMP